MIAYVLTKFAAPILLKFGRSTEASEWLNPLPVKSKMVTTSKSKMDVSQ